jgi:regulatory LuxR family protein
VSVDQERLNQLSPREREIYRLRTESYSKRMIANQLHISFHQVEEHLEAMRAKLGDDPYLPRNLPLDRLGGCPDRRGSSVAVPVLIRRRHPPCSV